MVVTRDTSTEKRPSVKDVWTRYRQASSAQGAPRKRLGVPDVRMPERRARGAQKRVLLMTDVARRIAAIAEMQTRAAKIAARDQRAAPAGS